MKRIAQNTSIFLLCIIIIVIKSSPRAVGHLNLLLLLVLKCSTPASTLANCNLRFSDCIARVEDRPGVFNGSGWQCIREQGSDR